MARVDNQTFYESALQRHGLGVRALHWNSIANQQVRFTTLLKLIEQPVSTLKIVDAGCGFGDLYIYMQEKPKSYIGLEVMEPMVHEARKRTARDILHVNMLEDALPEADYYLCSGAMNILSRFETRLFIKRALQHSRKGFVFNILKGRDESLVYNYYEAHEIRAIAKEEGVTCKIVTGYLPRDMSVGFYK